MQRRKPTNKARDNNSWIAPPKCSTITKIWSKLSTPKCYYAMCWLNKRFKKQLEREKNNYRLRSISNGKN
jgi:hypothetical protein